MGINPQLSNNILSLHHSTLRFLQCQNNKVHAGETERSMHEQVNEHAGDIILRLVQTHTPAVSEHANETGHSPLWDNVKFIRN